MNNNTVLNFPHGMKVAVVMFFLPKTSYFLGNEKELKWCTAAKDWYYILVKVQWLTPLMGTDLHCMVLDLNT